MEALLICLSISSAPFRIHSAEGRASFLWLFSSPWSFLCYFSRNSSSTLPCFQESESHLVVSDSLQPHGLYSPWNSPGQNTEVDSFSFFRGFSQPRDRTQVSHIAGRFFTIWTRKPLLSRGLLQNMLIFHCQCIGGEKKKKLSFFPSRSFG